MRVAKSELLDYLQSVVQLAGHGRFRTAKIMLANLDDKDFKDAMLFINHLRETCDRLITEVGE